MRRRLLRRLGLGQVLARVRHALRRGPAPLPRIGVALRAAAVPPGRRARRRRHRGLPPAVALPAAARHAERALVGRDASPRSQACCGCCSPAPAPTARSRGAVRGGLLAEHAAAAPAARATASAGRSPGHRARRWCRMTAQHPGPGGRGLARRVARAQPARLLVDVGWSRQQGRGRGRCRWSATRRRPPSGAPTRPGGRCRPSTRRGAATRWSPPAGTSAATGPTRCPTTS